MHTFAHFSFAALSNGRKVHKTKKNICKKKKINGIWDLYIFLFFLFG